MVKVGSGLEARDAFTAKQVDAACVWAPDDEDCIKAVKGSKVLTSTAQANSLVTDGLIAKKEWLDENKETAKKIVEAILWANSEIKYNK
jgi:NitT/TauT family transport system substrate-binding protein